VTTRLKHLLTGCRRIRVARQHHEADAVRGLIERMKRKMPEIITRLRAYNRIHAPAFNVFRAVGIERKETILHTPFLAFLLNPEAAHGQGFLFLKAFFDVLQDRKDFTAPRFKIESVTWLVESEVYAGQDGQIDLLIECPTHGYALVVENKIDAAEGDDQLWRYARWIQRSRPRYRTKQIVFLTPEGRAPVSHRRCQCVRASYEKEVRKFLETSLQGIKALDVMTCVRHYQATVKKITDDPNEDEFTR